MTDTRYESHSDPHNTYTRVTDNSDTGRSTGTMAFILGAVVIAVLAILWLFFADGSGNGVVLDEGSSTSVTVTSPETSAPAQTAPEAAPAAGDTAAPAETAPAAEAGAETTTAN